MAIDKAKNVERATPRFGMIILPGGQTALTEQITAVQRMQDYIETHLDETITPADLSRASLYSPWVFQPAFSTVDGTNTRCIHSAATPFPVGCNTSGRAVSNCRRCLFTWIWQCRWLSTGFLPGISLQPPRICRASRSSQAVRPLWRKI